MTAGHDVELPRITRADTAERHSRVTGCESAERGVEIDEFSRVRHDVRERSSCPASTS